MTAQALGSTSSSDMRWVQRARMVAEGPEIRIGGAIRSDSRVHAADERVRVADLLALVGGSPEISRQASWQPAAYGRMRPADSSDITRR